ncbi:hypothetical protein SAMN02910355_1147 [Terrisporobacter glycolicus]|nr:hypothetical protein SAMN02910355_1147 [Terrisporobacter glycolicus]
MEKEMDKDEILKIMQRQMIVFLIILIAIVGGFIYFSHQISELQLKVRTMHHELDYTKYRVEELEQKQ